MKTLKMENYLSDWKDRFATMAKKRKAIMKHQYFFILRTLLLSHFSLCLLNIYLTQFYCDIVFDIIAIFFLILGVRLNNSYYFGLYCGVCSLMVLFILLKLGFNLQTSYINPNFWNENEFRFLIASFVSLFFYHIATFISFQKFKALKRPVRDGRKPNEDAD